MDKQGWESKCIEAHSAISYFNLVENLGKGILNR
jgi:hypothetical protein